MGLQGTRASNLSTPPQTLQLDPRGLSGMDGGLVHEPQRRRVCDQIARTARAILSFGTDYL